MPPSGLSVDVIEDPRGVILRLSGSAGIAGAGELERRVNSLIARHLPKVALDLNGLIFLASLDIGLLVSLARAVRKNNGVIRMFGGAGNVADAIRRTGLETMIEPVGSLDEALA